MSDLSDVDLMSVTVSVYVFERWTTLCNTAAMVGMGCGGTWRVHFVVAHRTGERF